MFISFIILKNKFIKCVFMCWKFTIPFIQTIAFALGLNIKQGKPEVNIDFTVFL